MLKKYAQDRLDRSILSVRLASICLLYYTYIEHTYASIFARKADINALSICIYRRKDKLVLFTRSKLVSFYERARSKHTFKLRILTVAINSHSHYCTVSIFSL
jgi:hypothetical protein